MNENEFDALEWERIGKIETDETLTTCYEAKGTYIHRNDIVEASGKEHSEYIWNGKRFRTKEGLLEALRETNVTVKKPVPLYVSLPISGYDMAIVRQRCQAAKDKYSQRGYKVITPVDVVTNSSFPYALCMGKCIEALLECKAAVFLKGWGKSNGCTLEKTACDIYGINSFTDAQL